MAEGDQHLPQGQDHLRISEDDRHRVAEQLRQAAGEGRLDLEELDERLEAAYAARTYGDLVPITSDLPSTLTPVQRPAATPAVTPDGDDAPARPSRHLAVMGGLERKGRWTVPARMTVTCVMGGAELDLREATFAARECVLTVNAVMGGANITVGPGVEVVVEGTGIMGGYSSPSGGVPADLGPDSPALRVRGIAFWGGVSVQRKAGPTP